MRIKRMQKWSILANHASYSDEQNLFMWKSDDLFDVQVHIWQSDWTNKWILDELEVLRLLKIYFSTKFLENIHVDILSLKSTSGLRRQHVSWWSVILVCNYFVLYNYAILDFLQGIFLKRSSIFYPCPQFCTSCYFHILGTYFPFPLLFPLVP